VRTSPRRSTSTWALLSAVSLVVGACAGGSTTPTGGSASAPNTPPGAVPATAIVSPVSATPVPVTPIPATSEPPSVGPSAPSSAEPTAAGSATPGAPASPLGSLVPSVDLSTVGGPGEGRLDIIAWIGYAEGGKTLSAYDWVTPFQSATGCKVNAKIDDTSDQMVTDMRQGGGGVYDGVSASGDASNRLISHGDVSVVDTSTIPGFSDVATFLQEAPHYVVNGKHYGVPHGWGGNLLMYNTESVTPAPTSWDVVFDPAKAQSYSGKITDYDSPIYIADAALYLKTHKPELGITDPYELTADQLDAAVKLLKDQAPLVGKYWAVFGDEIDNFTNGLSTVGTTWPYQLNALKGAGIPVEGIVPSEGMTGWADTWMMSSKAKHPNCMLKWMAWMITPEVQAQVAEYFGESPANPKACTYLDVGYADYKLPGFCEAFRVNDQSFYSTIQFWKTPQADCGDSRGKTCMDYSVWTTNWTDIRG
jgi:putative spermidine/putrescine transport system substrate-binding protein